MPSDDISDIHRHYDLNPGLEADRLGRHPIEFEITMRHLKQHLPESGSVLDVGCATGAYSISLAKSGYDVTAVDISPALVQLCGRNAARKAFRITFKPSLPTHAISHRSPELSSTPSC